MKQRILYVGLNVDDTQYHGSALSQEIGEVLNFRGPLLRQFGRQRHQFGAYAHLSLVQDFRYAIMRAIFNDL